jgi:hypothetical protein
MVRLFHRTTLLLGAFVLILFAGACATAQPTPTPPAGGATNTPGGPVIETLPPRPTLERTATQVIPTDTVVAPTSPPVTAAPTITSSGPTLESSENNTKRLLDSAPAQVGPFTLVKDSRLNYATEYGLVLFYRTSEGALYEIKVWVTLSAGGANERYQAIVGGIKTGVQPLRGIGDEAIITTPPNPLYMAVRWRNISLEMYRPDPKGTTPKPITDDEARGLVQALFNLLSK